MQSHPEISMKLSFLWQERHSFPVHFRQTSLLLKKLLLTKSLFQIISWCQCSHFCEHILYFYTPKQGCSIHSQSLTPRMLGGYYFGKKLWDSNVCHIFQWCFCNKTIKLFFSSRTEYLNFCVNSLSKGWNYHSQFRPPTDLITDGM